MTCTPAKGYSSCVQEEAVPLMLCQKIVLPDGQHISLSKRINSSLRAKNAD